MIMVKVGDKVRFLNAVGGGIVRRIDRDVVLVEEEDGFETPVLARECVVIESGRKQDNDIVPTDKQEIARRTARQVTPQPADDDDEPELPHAIIGMKLAEKYKEKPDVCNAIGAHHDEVEMTSIVAPIIQVCDAISGARPGARREVVESYIKRLKEMEEIALSYPGVQKTYAIQAGRELRVIVGADKLSDQESEGLSRDIAKKIQDEMTYPGQVKITVIRETRAVAYAK